MRDIALTVYFTCLLGFGILGVLRIVELAANAT